MMTTAQLTRSMPGSGAWTRWWLPALAAALAACAVGYGMASQPIIVIGGLASTVIVISAFRHPTGLLVALIPLALLGPDMRTPRLALTVVAIVASLVALAVRMAAGSVRLRREHVLFGLLALVLLLAFLLPALQVTGHRVDPARGMPSATAQLTSMLSGLTVALVCMASRPRSRALLCTLALSGMGAAIYGLLGQAGDGSRLRTLLLNPNSLALLCAVSLLAAGGLAWQQRSALWLIPAGGCLLGMIATLSRTGLIATTVGLVFLLTRGRRFRYQVLISLAGLGTLIGLVVLMPDSVETVLGDRSGSNSERSQVLWFAMRVALEHPLRGVGLGNFPAFAAQSTDIGYHIAPHNFYLFVASEAGLPAVMLLGTLIVLALKRPQTGEMALVHAIAASYAVSQLFMDMLSALVLTMPFWIALGMLLSNSPATASDTKEGDGISVAS